MTTVLIVGLCAGCATNPPVAIEPKDLSLATGIRQFEAGKIDEAAVSLDRALVVAPDSAVAYFYRGKVNEKKKNDLAALADFDRAIALKSDFGDAYWERGLLKQRRSDLDGAMADCERAIVFQPEAADLYNLRGWLKEKKGDVDGAIEDFNKAIALAPDRVDGYDNRGMTLWKKGDFEAAMRDFNRQISIHPFDGRGYLNRGDARLSLHDVAGARADLTVAIGLDPLDPVAYRCLGSLEDQAGEFAKAVHYFELGKALAPEFAGVYLGLGVAKLHMKRNDEALVELEEAMKRDDKMSLAYYWRGEIRRIKNEFDGALADFDTAISLQAQSGLPDPESYERPAVSEFVTSR